MNNTLSTKEEMSKLTTVDVNFLGNMAVGATAEGMLSVFSVDGGDLSLLTILEGHNGPISGVKFTENGKYVISADFSGYLIVWDASNASFSKQYVKQLTQGPIYDISVSQHINGGYLVCCALDNGSISVTEFYETTENNSSEHQLHDSTITNISSNIDALVTSSSSQVKYTPLCGTTLQDSQTIYETEDISALRITRKNCFDKCYVAIGTEGGSLTILEQNGTSFSSVLDEELGEEILSLQWSLGGFSLSVVAGDSTLKTYEIAPNGEFEEVAVASEE